MKNEVKGYNRVLIGVTEQEQSRRRTEMIFEEIIDGNISELMKDTHLQFQEAQPVQEG